MVKLAERFVDDLEGLSDLPTHSPVLAQLLATLGRDDASLTDVAAIIRDDPVLSARVLRAANSVVYAARTPVATIREALLRLGFLTVRRLAMVVSLYTAVPSRKHQAAHEAYWQHSLGVAHASEAIARRVPEWPEEADPELLFLGGLLHDIGLLVLENHYPREYASVAEAAKAERMPFVAAERAVLETDHGELGALLARHWALPVAIEAMIRTHHEPETAAPAHRWSAHVVHLADFVCGSEGIGDFRENASEGVDAATCQALGIGVDIVPDIVEETHQEVRRALSLLHIVST